MDKTREKFVELAVKIIILFALGFLYKWCWNETMPYLFGLPTITYWKMVGLTLLAKVMFGKDI